MPLANANVQKDCTEINASHVLNLENGTPHQISVFVQHQKVFGTEINVSVTRICLVIIVCLVQLQELGI